MKLRMFKPNLLFIYKNTKNINIFLKITPSIWVFKLNKQNQKLTSESYNSY